MVMNKKALVQNVPYHFRQVLLSASVSSSVKCSNNSTYVIDNLCKVFRGLPDI